MCLGWWSYHLVVTVGREKVISQVEESQDAADSPHINGLGEGEAERNLWSSKKMETRAKDEKTVEMMEAPITLLWKEDGLVFQLQIYRSSPFPVRFKTDKGNFFYHAGQHWQRYFNSEMF